MKRHFKVPTLVCERFTLRPFRLADAENLQKVVNDERVARKVSNIPFPYTIEHAKSWIRKTTDWIHQYSERVDFVIEIAGEVAGSVSFINLDDHKAQVSYWLAPAHWGKGIMTDAVRELVRFGFEGMQLVRIFAYVYAENTASAQVLERAWFIFEGSHRKEWHKVIDGEDRFFDSLYFAIVRDDV